jgi:phosphoserine phosphatase
MRHADADPVLIFDLDETILRVNSFPLWVRFLVAGRIRGLGTRRRALLSLGVLLLIARRKLRRIDHATLLRQLQQTWCRATQGRGDALVSAFQAELTLEIRPTLRPLLQRVADGRVDAVLATAAAADYAAGLARQLGFRHVLTTTLDGDRSERNSGARKRDRVLALLREQVWHLRPRILFTDHIDDLPLIQECDAVCWFGQDAMCPDGMPVVCCLNLDADGLHAALDRIVRSFRHNQAAAHRDMTVS